MAKRSIQVKGLIKAEVKLRRLSKALKEDTNAITEATAFMLYNAAINNIQAINFAYSLGELFKGQRIVQERKSRFVVFNDSAHAGYVEFGTGVQVKIPSEWSDIAAEWLGRGGTFEEFVQRLVVWAKGTGIQPLTGTDWDDYDSMAFMMAIKILHNGLRARPFFYPAFVEARTFYDKEIELLIKNATK